MYLKLSPSLSDLLDRVLSPGRGGAESRFVEASSTLKRCGLAVVKSCIDLSKSV